MRIFESERRLEEKLRKCSYVTLPEEKRKRLKKQIMGVLSAARPSQSNDASASYRLHRRLPTSLMPRRWRGIVIGATLEDFGFEAFIEKIKKLALEISPRKYFRTLLKEKLITLVEFQGLREFSLRPRLRRKIFATVIAFVFLFSLVFHYTFKIERVEASFVTTLEQLSGEVSVIRGNSVIPGTPGLVLKTDDVIRTGKNSKTSIRFLDQSMSRLDENTEIKIAKLFVNPQNNTETIVELILHRGRLWSRVINLINNFSRFQVKAASTVAVAKKKAAFDVSISSKGKATVAAVKNKVDLVVATDKKVIETTIMKGFSAEVKNTNLAAVAPKITQEKIGEEKDEWILENLEEDEVYIEMVKQEIKGQIQDQVKVLPGNPFYAMKELSEGTKIALTFDDFDRQKKILITVREKLAEAQGMLEKGDQNKANELLQEFKAALAGIQTSRPAQAAELKALVDELLGSYEKQLAMILPGDPLYPLKAAVFETKLLVVENPLARTEERLSQATGKLLEAHDLAEQGDSVGAAQQVEAYSNAISDVVSDVKQMSSDEKEKAVTALIDNKVDDLKVLEAMVSPVATSGTSSAPGTDLVIPTPRPSLSEAKQLIRPKGETFGTTSAVLESTKPLEPAPVAVTAAAPSPPPELQKSLQDAKTETLAQLGEAVLQVQQNKSSVNVLQGLEGIKDIDVNGKQLVDVVVSRNRVQIRTDSSIISVTGTSTGSIGTTTFTLPKVDSGIPKSPPVQP